MQPVVVKTLLDSVYKREIPSYNMRSAPIHFCTGAIMKKFIYVCEGKINKHFCFTKLSLANVYEQIMNNV